MDKIFSNTIDRIKYFIEYKNISLRKFAEKTGLSHSLINKISSIGSDKLENVLSNYPELSAEWVLRGKEPMLISKEETSIPLNNSELLDRIERLVEEKAELKARIIELEKEKKYRQKPSYAITAEPEVKLKQK